MLLSTLRHLTDGLPEPSQGYEKEKCAYYGQRQHLGPEHVNAAPAKDDSLGQRDKVGGRSRFHNGLDECGHAFTGCHAAREYLHGQQD